MPSLSNAFPAGQHYVPKMLQKRFVDGDGMLWAFDKRAPQRGVWRSGPTNIFKERHIYTVTGPEGAPDALVERTLGRIEDAADPVIDRVVKHVRAGGSYNLTDEERGTLLLFLYIQHKRSPEFFRGISVGGPVKEFVENSIAAWEALNGPAPLEEREKLLSPKGLSDIEQSARMGALISLSPKILQALDERGLMIIGISRPDRSFILGSLPTVRFRALGGSTGLKDPGAEFWLPIAPDVAIGSYGYRHESRIGYMDRDGSIRKFNEEVVRQSNTIASSYPGLLRSLTRRLPATD